LAEYKQHTHEKLRMMASEIDDELSQAMPAHFNPEVPVYVGYMHEHCRSTICTLLKLPVPDSIPFLRNRV
jgi:hypothetical protein